MPNPSSCVTNLKGFALPPTRIFWEKYWVDPELLLGLLVNSEGAVGVASFLLNRNGIENIVKYVLEAFYGYFGVSRVVQTLAVGHNSFV